MIVCQIIEIVKRQIRPFFFAILLIIVFTMVWHQTSFIQKTGRINCKGRVLSPPSNIIEEDDGSIKYISPLCNCGKEVPVGSDVNVTEILNDSDLIFKWCSDESTIRGVGQKIVTYSLYGNVHNVSVFKRYFSLLKNISLTVEREYPGWVIRIYHNIRDEPGPSKEAHNLLCDVYCQFNHVDLCSVPLLADRIANGTRPIDPVLLRGLNPKMFRYLVMLDPNVDIFISRDVDSIIWRREVDAVDEWLNRSNYTFHLMRDHKYHGSIILAGMWGAKVHQRRDLIEGLMRALVLSGQDQVGWKDQASLDMIVWPAAKFDVMAHDSYQCENEHITRTSPLKVFPFPTKRNGSYYVGGAGHRLYPEICPIACRPTDHKDWEYC